MATEKKLEIVISEKGGEKLKDILEDIKIEALSIQKIADDAPNASAKISKQLENLGKNADKIIASTIKVKRQYFATTDELFKSFNGYNQTLTERFTQLSAKSSKLAVTMQQIQDLNEEAYKTLNQTSAAKLAASQAEIDALAKNAKSVEQVMVAYEKKKLLIEEQAEIDKARISAEYEDAKKAGGDIVALEKMKAENIAIINKKLTEDLKQNAKGYEASAKAFNDKLFSSFTADMDVAASTVSRKTKKMINNAATDAEEVLGITQGSLDKVAQAAIVAEDKNKKAAAEAKKTTESASNATAAAKATGDAATKAAEATKVIIDIDATRKNVEISIEALKHYQTALEQNGKAAIKQYDIDIVAAVGDHKKKKKLEEERAAAVKYYGEQLIKTRQALTVAEKKEHDLGALQWQQYGEKVKTVADNIKDTLTKTSEYFSTGLTAMSDVYKAEIAGITEDITHYAEKKKGIDVEIKESEKKAKELEEEKTKAAKEGNTVRVQELEKEVEAHAKAHSDLVNTQTKYQEKTDELKDKQAKKQAQQEKIEKLNRKAALIKSIAEATANIAKGVTKAFSYGPILGPVLAAVVTAAGAVQIGIMTKQLAKFADGGLLNGKRHSQGGMRIEGTNIEVEGGEYVVNRESTNKNLGLVRYINSQRRELTATDLSSFFTKASQGYEPPFRRMFEEGGQMPAIADTGNMDNDFLVDAIKSIKFEPRVAVTDILHAQNEVTQVDGWAGI